MVLTLILPCGYLYPRMTADSHGNVYRDGKVAKQSFNGSGYLQVWVGDKQVAVHILVCAAFHGAKPSCDRTHPRGWCGHIVAAHGPGGCLDNRPENLFWETQSENSGSDKLRDGTDGRGEKNHQAKLTEVQILEIKSLRAQGLTQREIAERYDVGQTSIGYICTGKQWAHVSNNG